MPAPISTRALLLLLLLLPSAALCARAPQPSARIPLEPLGFQTLPQRYLLGGSSMVTVHYVDGSHLLLTYVAHRLIPRTPGDPPGDQDRNVDAVLLELPSGRLLARTEWLLHDHGQYLWSLGRGQFLLRVRNTFTTFAPLAHLAHGQSFLLRPFLFTDRRVVLAGLSADAGLLTVETADPLPGPDPDSDAQAAKPAFTAGPPVRAPAPPPSIIQFNFYRLAPLNAADPEASITPRNAGIARSRHPAELPVSSAGLLHAADQGHQRWAFDFRAHDGKLTPLALFDSTCHPIATFISPSEFIALGCHGGDSRQLLAGFNLRGDAMWEQVLAGPFLAPSLAYAPAAGRFAFARVLTNIAAPADTIDPSLFNGQSLDVIQDDSGKTLLHLDCTPIVRAGQNFAFSPDGMGLAILHDTSLEIYSLPPLAKEDKTAIQLAERSTPPLATGPVNVGPFPDPAPTGSKSSKSASSRRSAPETAGPQLSGQSAALADDPSDSSFSMAPPPPLPEAGPADSNAVSSPVPRKPPTLYNPDAPSPTAAPQSTAPAPH